MACAAPLTAYRPADGGPVRFNAPNPDRDPRAFKGIEIPCGQCILCRLEKARQWAVRITHEAQLHEENSFITLTYDEQWVPQHNSLSTNSKSQYPWQRPEDRYHLQKFWKRLRKEIGEFRYFAVGEYGDDSTRPHYHACVFGHAFTEERTILRRSPTLLWTNPTLVQAWGLGHVSVGALTFQTAQYTAAYVTKKLNNKRQYVRTDEQTGEMIPLVQPRAYMSLRPAIGRKWLDRHGDQTFAHDRVVIEGKAQKPPKYYDRWLEQRSPIAIQMIKEQRLEKAKRKTPEQNRARARNAHARAKNRKGSV